MISDSKVFSNEKIVFDDPKEFDEPWVSDVLKVIANEGMDEEEDEIPDDETINMVSSTNTYGFCSLHFS